MSRIYVGDNKLHAVRDIGELVYKASSSETNGLLLCNGQAISRSIYSDLFAELSTTYGAGNGTTTFNVPDMRGRVPGGAGQGTFATSFPNTDVIVAANDITVSANDSIYTGTAVVLSTTGTAPAGLTAGTTYYAIRESSTLIMLATTRANAIAGTAIDITGQGIGTHTLTITYTNRTVGDVVGEESHGLTVSEIPSHSHSVNGYVRTNYDINDVFSDYQGLDTGSGNYTSSSTGGSTSHNIMQPTAFAGYWFIYTGVL